MNVRELAVTAVSAALARGADEAVATVRRNSVRQALQPPSGALLERDSVTLTLELEVAARGARASVIADPPGDLDDVAGTALSLTNAIAAPPGGGLVLRPPGQPPEITAPPPEPLRRGTMLGLIGAALPGQGNGRHNAAGAELTDELIRTSVCWHTGAQLDWWAARRKLWTWLDGPGGDLLEGSLVWGKDPPAPVPVVQRREQFAALREQAVPFRGETPMPVLLAPSVAVYFLHALAAVFSGATATGPDDGLAGRIGRRIANRSVSLTDDARPGHGPWGCPIDDEGSSTRRAAVIEHGRLTGLLHTRHTARITRAGRAGQGVRRGPGHLVRPGPRGFRLEPGADDVTAVRQAVRQGFEAVAVLRTPRAEGRGVISVPVLGWLLRSGEPAGEPLRAEIAVGLLPMLRHLIGCGPELLHSTIFSGIAAPAVLVDQVLVRTAR
jgi:PmbA/TldA metallopeptidase C-terminal domain